MTQRVIDHHRAALAHAAVSKRFDDAKSWRKYRSIALKLPVMIHNEGLAPALHFVAARGDDAQRAILDDLAKDLQIGSDRHALLAWSRGLKADELRAAKREVLRRLGWYKRMVQSLGKGEDKS